MSRDCECSDSCFVFFFAIKFKRKYFRFWVTQVKEKGSNLSHFQLIMMAVCDTVSKTACVNMTSGTKYRFNSVKFGY